MDLEKDEIDKNFKKTINQTSPIEDKETFVSTGGSAFVNKQGDIEGARLFSDMYSKVPFGELKTAVENNKPYICNETLTDVFELQSSVENLNKITIDDVELVISIRKI